MHNPDRQAGTLTVSPIATPQTRLESFYEALINVFIGFWINFVGNLVILPAVGFTSLDIKTNFEIGFWFTIISVLRTYAIRRWAQTHLTRAKEKLTQRTLAFFRKFGF